MKKIKKLISKFLLVSLVVALIYNLKFNGSSSKEMLKKSLSSIFFGIRSEASKEDDYYSNNLLLLELGKDHEIIGKREDQKVYPASLTKIMTSIVALENSQDLEEKLEISQEDFKGTEGAALAGFRPGDRVSKRDLLNGLLLSSGAEAANGLARSLGGEEALVELMNAKARELGLKDSHFTNPTGLHHEDHYTSARDMAKLLEYALKNKEFYEIFTSKTYYVESRDLVLRSRAFDKIERPEKDFNFLGGKTGYTSKAGLCLASMAEKNGKTYILISMGADGSPSSRQYNMIDAFNVYENEI